MLSFQGIYFTNDQRRNDDLHHYIVRPQSPQAASNYQVKLVQYAFSCRIKDYISLRNVKVFNIIIKNKISFRKVTLPNW